MKYDKKTTGDRIKALRIERGISQGQLAIRLGYAGRTAVSKIENGERNLPIEQIAKVAAILNTTPAYLMGWNDDAPEPMPEPLPAPTKTLSPTEEEILRLVGSMSEENKKVFLKFLKTIAAEKK